MPYSLNQNTLQRFGHLELIAKQVVEGFITGLHKSPFHGFSVEFAEHRQYNSGESTRHIDWKLFGKTDKLFVKRFEEETNLRCQIVVDNSSSMYFPFHKNLSYENPNKITFAAYCAASLTYLLKKQRDAYGLTIFSDDIEFHSIPKSTTSHQKYLFSKLEELLKPIEQGTNKKTSVSKSLHTIADSIHKRSLIIIFSDMFDNASQSDQLMSSLQHLKHNKHEVILFHVVDKEKEIEFNFENRPYKFIDMENGEELKLNPNEIKEEYQKRIKEYKKNLILRCGQYRIDYVEADINKGINDILLSYLTKRKKLH